MNIKYAKLNKQRPKRTQKSKITKGKRHEGEVKKFLKKITDYSTTCGMYILVQRTSGIKQTEN